MEGRHNYPFPWKGKGKGKWNKKHRGNQNRSEFYEDSHSTDDGASTFKIPDKPPPGLTGRALGLWHRDRRRLINKQGHIKKDTSIPLDIPFQRVDEIRNILNTLKIKGPRSVPGTSSYTSCLHSKYSHIKDSEFKQKFLRSITETIDTKMKAAMEIHMAVERNPDADLKYYSHFVSQQESQAYIEMQTFRKRLPAWEKQKDILSVLESNQVVVVSGETGCGKTTQVPQFILDAELTNHRGSQCHIVVTQPRRISAISVAERVAAERGEKLGVSVGYQIRLEKRMPRTTGSILFCTTGILLQCMQSDPVLRHVSHVILDEIHERDCISDFIITLLKDVIKVRKDLKVILMSATLNAAEFSSYFNISPVIEIPGFTFPVTEHYLEDVLMFTEFMLHNNEPQRSKGRPMNMRRKKDEDMVRYTDEFLKPYLRNEANHYPEWVKHALRNETDELTPSHLELIVQLVRYICRKNPPGAILIFLPGWDKISALVRSLEESGSFPSSKYLIIPLHSMMPTITQKSVFNRPPPGVRKIIVATNIAETSITIDDVVYVIDCGMIKMKKFDFELNLNTLKEEWISLANAKQRRGRAGRVQEGICYHLYSRPREMVMEKFQVPEMLRTRLEEIILQIKVLQLGKAKEFLAKVLNPPSERAIELSIELLRNLKALDEDENLTPLGYHLANLPIDPQAGKMILLGALFSCIDPITSIAASLSFKDAFVIPMGKEKMVDQVKLKLSQGTKSDHIMMAEAIRLWREAESRGQGKQFTYKHFLSHSTLKLLMDMKSQFVMHLYEQKFLDSRDVLSRKSNLHSSNEALIKAVICGGLFPNIGIIKNVRKKDNKGFTRVKGPERGTMCVHPKSVNSSNKFYESCFLAYYLKIKSVGGVMLHDTTMILPFSLIFFCNKLTIKDATEGSSKRKLIDLNNSIVFNTDAAVSELVVELREWLDWLLEYKISHPKTVDWEADSHEALILKAITGLLTSEFNMLHNIPEDNDGDDDCEDYNDYDECDW